MPRLFNGASAAAAKLADMTTRRFTLNGGTEDEPPTGKEDGFPPTVASPHRRRADVLRRALRHCLKLLM